MNHQLTATDGLFTVRQPAWHGLGNVLSNYPTREEAKEIAHNWGVVSEPLYRRIPTIDPDTGELTASYAEVPEFKANVRDDNDAVLGVVGEGYEVVQPDVMYDILDAIEGESAGTVQLETGGSLMGGRKVWLMARLHEPLVIKGDRGTATMPFYAIQNSYDGSGAFRGQALFNRIVCDNTSRMADWDAQAQGTECVFSHTKNVRDRIEQAKEALTGWRSSIRAYREMSDHLLDVTVTPSQRELFIEQFIEMPPPHTASARTINNVERARQTMRDIFEGPTTADIAHTAYGLVQGSVEYLQWYRKARSEETRFKRSVLDRNVFVSDAVKLAQEVALA